MSVSLEGFGELGISGQLVVTPRNSQLGPGPGLFCGVSGSQEACVLLCVLDLSFPTCGTRQLKTPERTPLYFLCRWNGAL